MSMTVCKFNGKVLEAECQSMNFHERGMARNYLTVQSIWRRSTRKESHKLIRLHVYVRGCSHRRR